MKQKQILFPWLLCLLLLLPVRVSAQTVDTAAVVDSESTYQAVRINGMLAGETPRLFRLTTKDGWVTQVQEWLRREDTPEEFRHFGESPDILSRLQQDTAEKFAQMLVLAMQDTEHGGAFALEDCGSRLTWNSQGAYWAGSLEQGGYLLLPANCDRVYTPQLLVVQKEAVELTYAADHYSQPTLSITIYQPDGSVLGGQGPVINKRELLVSIALDPGMCAPFFRSEKQVRTLSYCFGPGLNPQLEKASLRDGVEVSLKKGEDYTLNDFSDVTVYWGPDNTSLFFEDNGIFCFLDGSTTGKNGVAETLEVYNQRYGADLTEEDLRRMEGGTVVTLTLDKWEQPLTFQFPLMVEEPYIPRSDSAYPQMENGAAYLDAQYHFTISPLQEDPMGRLQELRVYKNYTIETQLLDGGVAGDGIDEELTPLTVGAFTLYRLVGVEQNFTEATPQQEIEAWVKRTMELNEGQGYQVIWADGHAKVYVFHAAQAVDNQGITVFAGLEPEEYLLVQTIYPTGYATLRTAYQITPEAWKASSFQPVTWRNYTGVYLPETGGIGTQPFTMIGTALLLAGAFLMIWNKTRKKESDL